jgi:plastocyanin
MAHAPHTAGARVVTMAVAALLLGACSSTSANNTTAPSASSSPTAAATSGASSGTSVNVTEKEYSITLSQATFNPGTYTFTIKNTGSFSHNLAIQGPGVDQKTSPTIGPGQSGSLTAALQAGSYELWCAVPGHKDRGMDMKITVG